MEQTCYNASYIYLNAVERKSTFDMSLYTKVWPYVKVLKKRLDPQKCIISVWPCPSFLDKMTFSSSLFFK